MTWQRSPLGDYKLTLRIGSKLYESTIIKFDDYELSIFFNCGHIFSSRAYCKTIKQAMQLEARIRLALTEEYK